MSRKSCEHGISYDETRSTYYLYMDLGKDPCGRRVRRYRTYPSLRAAQNAQKAFLAQREQEIQILTDPGEPAPEEDLGLTLKEWLGEWMRETVIPCRAGTTAYGYGRMIENYIAPMLGDIPLRTLSPKDLQHYYSCLAQERGLGGNTIRHHHALLSAALRTAVRHDLIEHCVTDRVEPPRFVPKETSYYTAEDLKKLYRLVEGHALEIPVHLAGSLGLRREEICGLRWDCVDFEQRRIHIRAARTSAGARIIEKETKNRSSARVLYMEDDICRLLRRELALRRAWKAPGQEGRSGCDLVAVDEAGDPFSPNRLTRAFTDFIRSTDLPPLTLHGLRHTFATVASAQGVPLFDIGKALGHSTPTITGRIYTHLTDQFHAGTLAKVADALK